MNYAPWIKLSALHLQLAPGLTEQSFPDPFHSKHVSFNIHSYYE